MVPVEPGLTNVEKEENGQRIVGMNTENAEINEGLIRFDIIFYVSRLVSSQKERDFVKTNYNGLCASCERRSARFLSMERQT